MISFVVACYNISPFLDDFFGSIERQTGEWRDIEYILVDDGSTDDTLQRLNEWFNSRVLKGRVITKENGGAASARNAGIEAATGDWVTFPDPDDYLSDNYIEEITRATKEDVDIIVCKTVPFYEDWKDSHYLDWKFENEDIIDLNKNPEYVQFSYAVSLLKLKLLKKRRILNDVRVKPTFEDGHLINRYLLHTRGLMKHLPNALYYYRRTRCDSLINTSWAKSHKYSGQMIYGYIDLLEKGRGRAWIKNVVLCDILWYVDYGMQNEIRRIDAHNFFRNVYEISKYISIKEIEKFDLLFIGEECRERMISLFKDETVSLFGLERRMSRPDRVGIYESRMRRLKRMKKRVL